jgi:hypothetical protein
MGQKQGCSYLSYVAFGILYPRIPFERARLGRGIGAL